MKTRARLIFGLVIAAFAPSSARAEGFVEDWIRRHHWPGAVLAVGREQDATKVEVAGLRKVGTVERLQVNDRMALASCTKQMTAVLAAQMVERGRLSLDTTLAEAFPELGSRMAQDYRPVTLWRLMMHEAGAPIDASPLPLPATRAELVQQVLTRDPDFDPGEDFHYSSRGIAILGAVLEKVSGQAFEELVAQQIWAPLDMRSCSFEPAADVWGHRRMGPLLIPIAPTKPGTYLPSVLNPAAGAFCNAEDWLKFERFELAGYAGVPQPAGILTASAFSNILFREVERHAYVYGAMNYWTDDLGRKIFYHYGQDGGNTAMSFLRPTDGVAAVMATNVLEEDQALWDNVFEFVARGTER